jgi:CheY-like chemotaxis protein
VIVLDDSLPGMNVSEVLMRLRFMPNVNRTPVVVLGAARAPDEREACLRCGASEHIAKPFDLPAYESVVQHIVRDVATRTDTTQK